MFHQEQLSRWRLILGRDAQECMARMSPAGCALSAEQLEMDEALEAIYASESEQEISRRRVGSAHGRPAPRRGQGALDCRGWRGGSIRFATSFPRMSWSCCSRTPSSGVA